MARIKIGVQLAPQRTSFAEYRQAWLRADDLGVDSIWNWDHFFPVATLLSDPTYVADPNGAHFEAWTTLAVLGTVVKHGQRSAVSPDRHRFFYDSLDFLSARFLALQSFAKCMHHNFSRRFPSALRDRPH